jgi:hypothetical protein
MSLIAGAHPMSTNSSAPAQRALGAHRQNLVFSREPPSHRPPRHHARTAWGERAASVPRSRAVGRFPSWDGLTSQNRGPQCGPALLTRGFQFFIFVYYSLNSNKFKKSIENTIKLRKI